MFLDTLGTGLFKQLKQFKQELYIFQFNFKFLKLRNFKFLTRQRPNTQTSKNEIIDL